MTEKQYRAAMRKLKKDAIKLIDDRIEKALKSGAIDLDKHPDNFLLPKAVMSAIGNEIKLQYKPFDKDYQRYAANIAVFL